MNCMICTKPITQTEDIHWLDDVIVCSDCCEHELEESA